MKSVKISKKDTQKPKGVLLLEAVQNLIESQKYQIEMVKKFQNEMTDKFFTLQKETFFQLKTMSDQVQQYNKIVEFADQVMKATSITTDALDSSTKRLADRILELEMVQASNLKFRSQTTRTIVLLTGLSFVIILLILFG